MTPIVRSIGNEAVSHRACNNRRRTSRLNRVLNFALLQSHVDDVVTVTEQEIVNAMRIVLQDLKLLIEPSPRSPWLLAGSKLGSSKQRVGIILSGGNVTSSSVRSCAVRPSMSEEYITHAGGCHCGRRFEVEAPRRLWRAIAIARSADDGYLHLIVPRSRFHLLQGADELTEYNSHGYGAALVLRPLRCEVVYVRDPTRRL